MGIAPDLRGFGETEPVDAATSYTPVDIVGDLVAILDHLDIEKACIVGHDWGAEVSWYAALIRPDRFASILTLSVPYTPRGEASLPGIIAANAPPDFYMIYFLQPGPADAELDADPGKFLRKVYFTNSGDRPGGQPEMRVGADGTLMSALDEPDGPMAWFDEDEIAFYAEQFGRTGFTPALDTYRSLHRGWELRAAWADLDVTVPALTIYGDQDIVMRFPGMPECMAAQPMLLPQGEEPVCLPGCGHWPQRERPDHVNATLLAFLSRHAG